MDGPPERWIEALGGLLDDGFDTFILWPSPAGPEQVHRFAAEVVPALATS